MKETVLIVYLGSSANNRKKNILTAIKSLYSTYEIIIDDKNYIKAFIRFIPRYLLFLIKGKQNKIDFIYVGYFGHVLVPLIKLFSRKPIIFDAYLSIYAMLVEDRKKIKEQSILSKLIYYLEKQACKLSSLILLDTKAHVQKFANLYNINTNKIKEIYIGTDEDSFFPIDIRKKAKEQLNIVFCGHYIPLHGVNYIVQAANLLKNKKEIRFTLIGNGQTYDEVYILSKDLGLNNITFINYEISKKEVNKYYNNADLILGIFGDGNKSQTVIPNKIFDAIVTKTPVLTMNTLAVNEIFKDKKNIFLVRNNNPKNLAESIKYIYENSKLREEVGKNAFKLYYGKLSSSSIKKNLEIIFSNR